MSTVMSLKQNFSFFLLNVTCTYRYISNFKAELPEMEFRNWWNGKHPFFKWKISVSRLYMWVLWLVCQSYTGKFHTPDSIDIQDIGLSEVLYINFRNIAEVKIKGYRDDLAWTWMSEFLLSPESPFLGQTLWVTNDYEWYPRKCALEWQG